MGNLSDDFVLALFAAVAENTAMQTFTLNAIAQTSGLNKEQIDLVNAAITRAEATQTALAAAMDAEAERVAALS